MKQTNALKMELPGSSKYKLADLDMQTRGG